MTLSLWQKIKRFFDLFEGCHYCGGEEFDYLEHKIKCKKCGYEYDYYSDY